MGIIFRNKIQLLSAMGIFGTIGLFVRFLPLSSPSIAFFRGVMGVLFLMLIMLLTHKKPDLTAVRKNLLLLLVSGAAIGVNWILLFEAYKYTTVATATVCYYLAPLFLVLASPLLGERLTLKKCLCATVALIGMACVSGVLEGALPSSNELAGIGCGMGAAILYASVMLMNKKLSPIPAYDKTVVQLAAAAIAILPYLLLTEGLSLDGLQGWQWVVFATVGILHTGIAYALYFGSMSGLSAQTIAIFSYIDPVVAVLLSVLVLNEAITPAKIIGAALILGSALFSEVSKKNA